MQGSCGLGRIPAACTNIGVAPTFERRESRVEAYLLGFEGDAWSVRWTWLPAEDKEKRFGVEELKTQISRDVEAAGTAIKRNAI